MISKSIFRPEKYTLKINDTFVKIPSKIMSEIEENWQLYIQENAASFNNQLYTIDKMIFDENILRINVKKTMYSHYIYSRSKNFTGKNICKSIASNAIILTSDNFLVFVKMSSNTSSPKIIKFIGGSFSESDRKGELLDPKNCVTREIFEECGVAFTNENTHKFEEYLLITRKNMAFLNFLFFIETKLTSIEISSIFEEHITKLKSTQDFIELESLYFVKNKEDELLGLLDSENYFIDYFKDTISVFLNQMQPGDIKKYL